MLSLRGETDLSYVIQRKYSHTDKVVAEEAGQNRFLYTY